MLYEPNDVKTSERQLEKIFRKLPSPICLLGGWAAYHIVNKSFEKANGRRYIGSRDIDIGFHIDKKWTDKQLKKSKFATAIGIIENMGFRSISFRLVKDFDLDTGRELTPEESTRLPLYQIFQLYVDPIVDHIHPKIKDLLGFVPIDEPFLSLVFKDKMHTKTTLFEKTVLLPKQKLITEKPETMETWSQEHGDMVTISTVTSSFLSFDKIVHAPTPMDFSASDYILLQSLKLVAEPRPQFGIAQT